MIAQSDNQKKNLPDETPDISKTHAISVKVKMCRKTY